jgi:glyoxylase-like metal-dependent hydrolase (beta-lactamase superfamily II)
MEIPMLKFENFPVGPLDSICIIVWDPDRLTGVVVDPGGDAHKIISRVKELGLKIIAALHTHAHFDHIGATREIQDSFQCPAYFHDGDQFLLDGLDTQTAMFGMPKIAKPEVSILNNGDIHHELRMIHTPGHTPGSCCFLGEFECGPVLLSGDTLFRGGAGRTDLWGGSQEQLESSLDYISSLGDDTLVIPGHGFTTTIGNEIKTNPCMRQHTSKFI